MTDKTKIAIIGGSGLYDIEGLQTKEEREIDTPFGKPSDAIKIGELGGVGVAFLPRHGKGHRIHPGGLNVRANIWALKTLGVEKVISVSAVGSLREEIAPRDFVVPDQFFDHTKGRKSTFFDSGPVVHVPMADPYCGDIRTILIEGCKEVGVTVHEKGTYINMEGPQFSTRGESHLYRKWGMDIIGMTSATEAKLAREAEMCYATVALSTDYDCWHEEDVTIEMILGNMADNVDNVKRLVTTVVPRVAEMQCACGCNDALAMSILTDFSLVDKKVLDDLKPILEKYMK